MSSKDGEGQRQTRKPRRLFSFDSMKNASSRRTNSESSLDQSQHSRGQSKFSTLSQLNEDDSELPIPWAQSDLADSPVGLMSNPFNDVPPRAESPRLLRSESPKPSFLRSKPKLGISPSVAAIAAPNAELVPPSPSSARWDTVRQMVLPVTPPAHVQQASLSSSTSGIPRSQTPKPSRIAHKLGFKHVVENARDVVVGDTRKLAYELQKACWSTRYGEIKTQSTLNSHGSSLSINQLTNTSNFKTRRTSLPTTQLVGGSLKQLYHILLQHASSTTQHLPLESLVLSTLLLPFLTFDKGTRVDEERWFAVESFETIRKTWRPVDETSGVERCMWCVKAAHIPPSPLRIRAMTSLWNLTVIPDTSTSLFTPLAFQTLMQGLFSLLPWLDVHTEEGKMLTQIIFHVRTGSCGELDYESVEQDYNAIFLDRDSPQAVRDVMTVEALGKCLENLPDSDTKWLLANVTDDYWPPPPRDHTLVFSPLLASIHSRKLNSITRKFCSLLQSTPPDSNRRLNDSLLIIKITRERVLPELSVLSTTTVLEAKRNIVKTLMIMLTAEDASDVGRWCIATISHWYREASDWKSTFEKGLKHLITDSPWDPLIPILLALVQVLPQEVCRPILILMLSTLNDRLVNDAPPHPDMALSSLFATLSQAYPQIFYKPLFSCAASTKEISVVNHLCIINAISTFLPNFWTHNAEMVSVAVMSEIGGPTGKDKDAEGNWGIARLGQSVLLLELTGKMQEIRRERDNNSISDASFVDAVKFAYELEARLSALLQAKERNALVPPSQRLLFCVLFREIRLLTKSLKVSPWITQVVSWFVSYHDHMDEDFFLDEVEAAVQVIQNVYLMVHDSGRHKQQKRSTVMLSYAQDPVRSSSLGATNISQRHVKLLQAIGKGYIVRAMKLLVTVALILTPNDFGKIGQIVWERYLDDDVDPSVLASACFLIMQCGEKAPSDLQATIEVELGSLDRVTKFNAISRISTLSNWRFQIANQLIVMDRSRRPFKLARQPLPFLATDIGTNQHVLRDDPSDMNDNLPAEMRKRLAEIGWVDDDAPVNRQMERVRTPFSLLAVQQLDRLDTKARTNSYPSSPTMTPLASPQKGSSPVTSDVSDELALLRRNSSTGGPMYGVKRRAVFVPSVARIFPMLTSLVFDDDFAVAHVARATVIDLMRNDPSLLTRPVLDLLVEESKDVPLAVTSFRAFLHVRHTLPPSMAHHIFNYLTGFLKYNAKHGTTEEALHEYAYIIPILAKLVPQVSELSLRDFRRAKVDLYFIPSGLLFFPHTISNPLMFPTSLGRIDNPFDDVSARLTAVTMIRISQNLLFLDMLKKNPQDVQLVRKSMTRLILPSWDENLQLLSLEIKDFLPRKGRNATSMDPKLQGISILLSRSYLPLVAQIFRSMPRHLNDRSELAVLLDGVNRILITHGRDIGIVSQALIALMVASTRFHRLFISRGGYTLFMSAVMKVYAEAEMHSGIRMAIEYSVNRFFAHHKEAFVYQSLDVIAHIIALPDADTAWIGKHVYELFSSLKKVSPEIQDAAGIHDANKLQEREALMVITAEEKPQTFLASLRRGGKNNVTIDLPEEYETKRLSVDNLVRLFLTVIAHDPTIIRSEQFLGLLAHLTPHLYHSSASARNILQQGIEALGDVLRLATKTKGDGSAARPTDDIPQDTIMDEILDQQLNEKSKTPADFVAIRLNYFTLVIGFTRAGGQLSSHASSMVMELVKNVLRETNSSPLADATSAFIVDFTKASCAPENNRSIKAHIAFLKDLSSIVNSYALTIDFSGLFDVVSDLCTNSAYYNEPAFSRLVVSHICVAGLNACNLAAQQKILFTLPWRMSLVRLLSNSTLLFGADVFVEIEKYAPTYEYLVGLMLPLALALRTTTDLDRDSRRPEPWHRDAHHRAWVRLLSYTLSACQKPRRSASDPSVLERSKSRDGIISDKNSRLFTLVTALQIIKVIVVRGAKDLSSALSDVWLRIASFLGMVLVEGNGDFSFGQADYSPSASPTPSPRASGQFDYSLSPSNTTFPSLTRARAFYNPRVVDYCMWSFLEFLCAYRSPLVLQLRLFMKEKVFTLDSQLRSKLQPSRPTSSIFSKPRRRYSGMPSPKSSPRIQSLPPWEQQDTTMFSLDPRASPAPNMAAHNIVHLGPSNADTFQRSISPMSNFSASAQAKSTKIKSLSLIQATYRRIRVVQSCMGYQSMLLPWPAGEEEESTPITWTAQHALKEVMNETRQLLEEFEESSEGDDTVVISLDQSFG